MVVGHTLAMPSKSYNTRMNKHFVETRMLINCGIQPDTFANNFSGNLKDKLEDVTLKKVTKSDEEI